MKKNYYSVALVYEKQDQNLHQNKLSTKRETALRLWGGYAISKEEAVGIALRDVEWKEGFSLYINPVVIEKDEQ